MSEVGWSTVVHGPSREGAAEHEGAPVAAEAPSKAAGRTDGQKSGSASATWGAGEAAADDSASSRRVMFTQQPVILETNKLGLCCMVQAPRLRAREY